MRQAMDAVLSKTMGYQKAAKLYGVPQSTLAGRVREMMKYQAMLPSEVCFFKIFLGTYLPHFTFTPHPTIPWGIMGLSQSVLIWQLFRVTREIQITTEMEILKIYI